MEERSEVARILNGLLKSLRASAKPGTANTANSANSAR